jgi:uncharacterized membrane protein YebE (DUF533 family)
MRGWKIVAIAVGALVAFLLIGTLVHVIFSALVTVAVVAAIAGAIYVAVKISRSNKQVTGKQKDHEVRDRHPSSNALEGFDLDRYTAPTPPPRPASRTNAQDVDDELARLKREMGS